MVVVLCPNCRDLVEVGLHVHEITVEDGHLQVDWRPSRAEHTCRATSPSPE